MTTDQIETKTPPIPLPAASAPPSVASRTTEEDDYLRYLRDAMVVDPAEPLPTGWRIYTTPKFLGRACLAAYGATLLSVWLAPYAFRGNWLPVLFSMEAAIFSLPVALAGAAVSWASPEDSALEQQRSWKGRLATTGAAYLLMQTVAALFGFLWVNAFTLQ